MKNLLGKTKIALTIYTLDSLSLELHLQHRDIVHKYLGLPLDTGQIVSIRTFVDEYNKASKGIATPLNNTFLHREEELENIKQVIKQKDFLIITGIAGVGKTKIAIEAINSFLAENLSYNAFCLSYKNCELLSDLYQHFDDKKDYILFVDDANRIDAFNQITGFYKSQRQGNLKIIITARDYALPIVESYCFGFAPVKYTLKKFSDEQITDIIKAEPFNISNWQFHKEIIRIADGNPRLAIMTALLAKQEQNIYALADVSDLFEKYFSTFINDDGEFSNQFNIKCLGIIAFFNAVPYKDKNTIELILLNFHIDYSSFIDAIEKLDRLELVEIRYDYVKIPEQNLAIFFFYKAFVKDNLLSFETLLKKYFNENKNRFKDCVIPANNTFGFVSLSQKFTNPTYEKYLILDWDRFRDKESYDFENHQEYEKLKEEEIRKSFIFNNIKEIELFYNTFIYLKSIAKNDWGYNNSFDLIVDENCSRNFELGCQFLTEVINADNQTGYVPRTIFRNQLTTQEKSQYIWNIIQGNDFKYRYSWELSFYDNLADNLINEKYIEQIKDTVKRLPDKASIWFGGLKRYLSIEPNLFVELLQIIIDKNEKQNETIFVQFNIIEDYFEELGNDIDLIKKLYLQQDSIDNHFDLTKKGFSKIIQRDENFLIEYLDNLYLKNENQHYLHKDRYLNVIWESTKIEPILKNIFDFHDKKEVYLGIGEHFCNSFFGNLSQEASIRAKNFLLNYCKENYDSYKKMNLIVDIVRHSMKELFEDVLLLFISLTQEIDLFSKIWWRGNGGTVVCGDVNLGDLEASDWRNILSIVEKSDLGIKLIPIKKYLNSQIENALRYADWERKRKFIEDD